MSRRPAQQLPRGRHGLTRKQVVDDQSGRLLDAISELAARDGLGEVSVQDVIGLAGVSRATFYQIYRDRYHCYAAAQDRATERLVSAMDSACADGRRAGFGERLLAALEAGIETLEGEPGMREVVFELALISGPSAARRRQRAMTDWIEKLEPARRHASARRERLPPGRSLPRSAAEMAAGGVLAALASAGRRRPDREIILAGCLFAALLPFLGPAAAIAERDRLLAGRPGDSD